MPILGARAEAGDRCEDRPGGARDDGMEKTNKCDHFTIRGYVADVRKQDAKICWPLSVPHNQTVEALASSLPPLIAPDFGRWYCGNCLNSRVTSEEAKGSTAVWTENAAARINDFPTVLKNDADNLLSSFQQPSKIVASGIDVAEVGTSSVIVDNNEVSPVVCHDSKELQNLRKESTTGHLSKDIRSGSEENQRQLSKSTVSAAEYNSFEAGNNVRKDVTLYVNNLDTSPHDTTSNKLVRVKRSDIDLNRTYEGGDISDGALTYDRIEVLASCNGDCDKISAGDKTKLLCDDAARKGIVLLNGSCTEKEPAPYTTMSPSTNQVNLDQIKDRISCSMDISDDLHNRNHERVAGSSNGKFSYKKGRKIRLRSLEDIMRKDASYTPKDLCFSKGDAKLPKTKSVYDTPCRLNCEVKHSTNNLCQTSEPTTVKSSLVDSQAGENNDDETSLKHWLTSVSKKTIAEKGSSLTKHTEDTACGSVGKPSKKGVHMKKNSGETPQQKDETEKENKRPRIQSGKPCHGSQQKNLISEDEPIKFVHSKNIQRMRTTIPEKNLDIDHGNMDNSCDEMCDSNKKSKRNLQVGDGSSSSMLSKKEMIKKQRTTSKSRKATLEDIPMDVVEILAKIQYERHLPTAKFSTDMSVSNDSYVARGCKSSSWGPVHTNLGSPNDMERTIHVRDQNFQVGQATCDSSKHQKRNLHIDLNEQASDSYQTMPDFIGHNPFKAAPFDYLKEGHSCHYLPLDKIQMQPFGFCHEDLVPFAQNSRRTVPDTLALPRSDRIFGVNMRMSCPEQNFVNTVSHDGYLREGLVTVVKKSEEARKSSDAYVMNAGWNAEQSTNRVSLPFETCCMEGQNRYHFGTMDLSGSCSNGTVSATNLLKLVNQAAFSGASLDRNSFGNSDACCNSPCTVIHGSEFGMRNKEVLSGSWGDAYSSEDQISRDFSQPHRPVARIGIFGPLLQDEITTHTNKYGTTMGSEVSQADELPYLQITGEKVECSYSSVHSKCRNMDGAVLVRKSVPTMSIGSSLVQGYSSSRYGRDQVVIARKEIAVHHARNSCATECCIINRNPADFTLPDDDNEYMR